MFELTEIDAASKPELYVEICKQLEALLEGERDLIANLANAASLLYNTLADVNWAGFYLFDGTELVLGPFQGKPACVRIAVGRGVCGTAAKSLETVVVEDVDAFPGHIACDSASRSEIVVPIVVDGSLLGVLDLDSPVAARFDAADRRGLEQFVSILVEATDLGRG